MSERSSRRRLRLRRKRKGESFGSKLSDTGNVAKPADGSGWVAEEIAAEVVFRSGCCLLEAVVSASVLAALLTVPAYFLLTRVT